MHVDGDFEGVPLINIVISWYSLPKGKIAFQNWWLVDYFIASGVDYF